MNKLMFIGLFLGLINLGFSQNYFQSIGLRGGLGGGLTYKMMLNKNSAGEGIIFLGYGGINFTGLYEIVNYDFGIEELNWFYGGGAHIGFHDGRALYENDQIGYNENHTLIGLDGIIGIEYTFDEVPLNISIDWKPTFHFIGYTKFWADGAALSIRYILN